MAALSGHAVSQTTSKRVGAAETAKERVLRNALELNQMRPIATVAAAQLRQVPEFLALEMPPGNSTSRALIAWAGTMRTTASAYGKTFASAEMERKSASCCSVVSGTSAAGGGHTTMCDTKGNEGGRKGVRAATRASVCVRMRQVAPARTSLAAKFSYTLWRDRGATRREQA